MFSTVLNQHLTLTNTSITISKNLSHTFNIEQVDHHKTRLSMQMYL